MCTARKGSEEGVQLCVLPGRGGSEKGVQLSIMGRGVRRGSNCVYCQEGKGVRRGSFLAVNRITMKYLQLLEMYIFVEIYK